MDPDEHDEYWCWDINIDPWAPYRGKYPEPTHEERHLIHRFLSKFALEDDNFDEDADRRWVSLKESLRIPNLRSQLIDFLTLVRQSKGYDVDLCFDFSAVPAWNYYNIFVPRSLDEQKSYEEAMAATKFAIGEINACTEVLGGKKYEVVSVDKFVSTTKEYSMLLSFTAKEIGTMTATADFEAFQAMVVYAAEVDVDAAAGTPFRLKEWKFRPRPIHKRLFQP